MNSRPETAKLVYVASPYTHKDEAVQEQRYQEITNITRKIINAFVDVVPYTPITYTHVLAQELEREVNWIHFDMTFLFCCDALLVVQMDGWKESVGVQEEIKKAKDMNIHTMYAKPHQVLELLDQYRKSHNANV